MVGKNEVKILEKSASWTAAGSDSATPLWMFHRPAPEESKAVSALRSATAVHTRPLSDALLRELLIAETTDE